MGGVGGNRGYDRVEESGDDVGRVDWAKLDVWPCQIQLVRKHPLDPSPYRIDLHYHNKTGMVVLTKMVGSEVGRLTSPLPFSSLAVAEMGVRSVYIPSDFRGAPQASVSLIAAVSPPTLLPAADVIERYYRMIPASQLVYFTVPVQLLE